MKKIIKLLFIFVLHFFKIYISIEITYAYLQALSPNRLHLYPGFGKVPRANGGSSENFKIQRGW
jgi:hypothetical protein